MLVFPFKVMSEFSHLGFSPSMALESSGQGPNCRDIPEKARLGRAQIFKD